MSGNQHLSLYKSKSGNHLSGVSRRERLQEEKKKNRNQERHEAFTAHRVFEKTPQKQLPGTSGTATVPDPTDNVPTEVAANKSVLNRTKAFLERFQRYREKREKESNAKKKVIPFVSSVPTGRFVAAKSTQATTSKVATVPKKVEVKQGAPNTRVHMTTPSRKKIVSRISPVNTRSKKFKLLSPSQLPTPVRKPRNQTAYRKKTTEIKPGTVYAPNANDQPTTSRKALVTKVTNIAPKTVHKLAPTVASASAQGIKNKITSVNSKPSTQPKKLVAVAKPFKITAVPKIPSQFDFATSTARKTTSRQNSVQLFNESFSPIENGTPKLSIQFPNAPIEAPPQPIDDDVPQAVAAPGEKNDLNVTPANDENALNTSVNYVSPFVTISRGKHGASKERQARETKYKLESRKSIDLNTSTEDRQNKEAASYFRKQIKSESDRLLALVTKWVLVKEEDGESISSEYTDLIDVAIGQTRLLINNKFEQFRGLVEKCDAGITLHPVHPEDLEGFWGMVYMQVENCNERFGRLDVLKANDWQDPDIKVTKTKKIKMNGAITKTKTKTITNRANSVLANMLMEARKKCKQTKENEETNQIGASIFSMTHRKSFLTHRDLNNSSARRSSTPRKTVTPRKSIWVVEEQTNLMPVAPTPQRGILKTPGSMRKARSVLFLNKSPEVLMFNTEN